MEKIKMIVEIEYNEKIMHGDCQEETNWFCEEILLGEKGLLLLHSNELGDNIGTVKGLKIIKEQ